MSPFKGWCREAHRILQSESIKVPYGHVQQLLAAGFGHPSLHALQKADSWALESAAFALCDEAAILHRAAGLGLPLTEHLLNEICVGLRNDFEPPTFIRARYFEYPARRAFPSEDHLSLGALAQEITRTLPNHAVGSPQATWAEALGPFQDGRSWSWNVRGTVLALKDGDDYEVPFTAQMEFPSFGLRLLAKPVIHNAQPSGPPEPWDPGITDYAYLSDSDS